MTDLYDAGLIGDPLYEDNFLNYTYWGKEMWTYSLQFTATKPTLGSE